MGRESEKIRAFVMLELIAIRIKITGDELRKGKEYCNGVQSIIFNIIYIIGQLSIMKQQLY